MFVWQRKLGTGIKVLQSLLVVVAPTHLVCADSLSRGTKIQTHSIYFCLDYIFKNVVPKLLYPEIKHLEETGSKILVQIIMVFEMNSFL